MIIFKGKIMISAVINTLNEEENIDRCLESLKGFVDEIIVVDMYSNDKTVDIAKKYGAKVYYHDKTGYVEPARNFAIEKAVFDWIFLIDADEKLPRTLAFKLKEISNNNDSADFYRIPRKNILFSKWMHYSRWWPDYNIRFFKKDSVVWSEIIHSVPQTKGVGFDLEAKEEYALVHYHYNSIEQYIERLNRYTTQSVKGMIDEGIVFEWKDLINKPVGEFLSRFFFGKGYKDGIHGLALSGLQAFSEFVVYLKLWQNEKFSEKTVRIGSLIDEIDKSQKEINYWKADAMVYEHGGILSRIKRRLKI